MYYINNTRNKASIKRILYHRLVVRGHFVTATFCNRIHYNNLFTAYYFTGEFELFYVPCTILSHLKSSSVQGRTGRFVWKSYFLHGVTCILITCCSIKFFRIACCCIVILPWPLYLWGPWVAERLGRSTYNQQVFHRFRFESCSWQSFTPYVRKVPRWRGPAVVHNCLFTGNGMSSPVSEAIAIQ